MCDNVVCKEFWVWVVCLCVKELCVKALCVKDLCVCDKVVCV